MVKKCVENLSDNIIVKVAGKKMIQDICHEERIFNVFRGVKAGRTFEEEMHLQITTKYLAKQEYGEEIFFIYDITSEEDFRGSSIVKILLLGNKDVSTLVPECIMSDLKEKAIIYR